MLKLICAIWVVALTAGASAPAAAQVQKTPAASKQQPAGPDPNEIVCQKQEVTGSRLVAKKVCKTRAQWADSQLQDRQELERVQSRRGMKGE